MANELIDVAISMRKRLFGYAYTLLGGRSDDTNDALQDVMLSLLVRGVGRMPNNPRSYLLQTVHHRCVDYVRGDMRRNFKEGEYAQTLPPPPSLYDTVAARLELEHLGKALAAVREDVTPKERAAFEALLGGDPLTDTQRVSLFRFRKRLREEMRR